MEKNVLYSGILALAILAFVLFFTGCQDNTEDYSISEITISNIPALIPVMGNETVSNPAFKVYLNASDSMSENDPPAAKGIGRLGGLTPVNGTYTVTIQLQNPNPDSDEDPNSDTGSWSGTALFFSVVISPQDTTLHGANAIWTRAGTTLDKGKANLSWENLLPDFRVMMEHDPNDELEFSRKNEALYNDIVRKDNEITTGP